MTYVSEVLADSPAVLLRNQEASGFPQDSSGNARHTTASPGGNNAIYHKASPILSDAADFAIDFNTGTNFTVPDQAGLDLGDVFTMEAWVKLSTLTLGAGLQRYILSKGANAYSMWVGAQDDTPALAVTLVAPTVAVSCVATVSFADLLWHHCVITKNGGTVHIYFDGVDVTGAYTPNTFVNTAETLFIGSSRVNDGFANAQLDEVAVYPTALTQGRVQAHFNAAYYTALRSQYKDYEFAQG